MSLVDPYGLLSVLFNSSAEYTLIKGGALSAGEFLTTGGKNGKPDIGVYGTVSTTTGLNAGVAASMDILVGGRENIDGQSTAKTVCFLAVCFISHDNTKGKLIGLGIGIGKGFPGGFSGSNDYSRSLSFRDIIRVSSSLGKRLYEKTHEDKYYDPAFGLPNGPKYSIGVTPCPS